MALLLILVIGVASIGHKDEALVQVSGKIYEAVSRKPVSGVSIHWKDATATSDQEGNYKIAIPVGIRELLYHYGAWPEIRKNVIARDPSQPVTLDLLFPRASDAVRIHSLVTDRGPGANKEGKRLDSEYPGDSMISISDGLGNQTQFLKLQLKGLRAHSPV